MVVDILHTLIGFAAVTNLMLGIIVFGRKRSDLAARIFLLLSVSIFLWSSVILLFLRTNLFIFDKLSYVGGSFSLSFAGLFLATFAYLKPKELKLIKFFFVFNALFFSIASLFPNILLIRSSINENRLVITSEYGPLQISFLTFGAFSILIFIIIFIKAFQGADPVKKKQVTYIGYASIVASFIALSTNLFLPTFKIEVFGGIGPISALVFSSIVTYAILKENVLDIKILFAEVIVFIFLAYSGALMFLAENLSDFGFKFLSFLFTFFLSMILLRSIHNENRLRADLEIVYQNQSNFLADIAHRLKSPLAVVRTSLDLANLELRDQSIADSKKAVAAAIKSTDKLSRLSTNLITLGKIDFGINKLHKTDINLSKVVEEAGADFQSIIEERRLMVKVKPNIRMFADEARMQELVFNLLDNANKFTDSILGQIRLSLKQTNQQIILSVLDNGRGIKETNLPHLFDRYYQAHNQTKSGSAGIGLAIVKWIVEGHGGKIEVESKEGGGTKFTVNFN